MINKHLGAQCKSGLLAINHQQEFTVFETSFSFLHMLPQSTDPFYIWHSVANPPLPAPFSRQMSGGSAGSPAARCCSVGGCGEPTQAASPAPRCWRNPCGTGPGQLEVGRLTFPAQQTNWAGGYCSCRDAESASTG